MNTASTAVRDQFESGLIEKANSSGYLTIDEIVALTGLKRNSYKLKYVIADLEDLGLYIFDEPPTEEDLIEFKESSSLDFISRVSHQNSLILETDQDLNNVNNDRNAALIDFQLYQRTLNLTRPSHPNHQDLFSSQFETSNLHGSDRRAEIIDVLFQEETGSVDHVNPDILNMYIKEAKRHDLLSREEELAYIMQYERGLRRQLHALAYFPGVVEYTLQVWKEVSKEDKLGDLVVGLLEPLKDVPVFSHEGHYETNMEFNEDLTVSSHESKLRKRLEKLDRAYSKFLKLAKGRKSWLHPSCQNSLSKVARKFSLFKFSVKHQNRITAIAVESWECVNRCHEKVCKFTTEQQRAWQKIAEGCEEVSLGVEYSPQSLQRELDEATLKNLGVRILRAHRCVREEELDQRHSRNSLKRKLPYIGGSEHKTRLTTPYISKIIHEVRRGVTECNEAREALVVGNLRLVISLARKHRNPTVDFADLISEGNLGLLRAIEKYDYRRGTKLATYATWWIRQSITRALGSFIATVRLPVHVHERLTILYKCNRDFVHMFGKDPSPEDLSRLSGLNRNQVQELKWLIDEDISVEQLTDELNMDAYSSFFGPSANPSPEELFETASISKSIATALGELNKRESSILKMRFGINSQEEKTLQQVGELYGLSRERVRQIEANAMRKLSCLPILKSLAPSVMESKHS